MAEASFHPTCASRLLHSGSVRLGGQIANRSVQRREFTLAFNHGLTKLVADSMWADTREASNIEIIEVPYENEDEKRFCILGLHKMSAAVTALRTNPHQEDLCLSCYEDHSSLHGEPKTFGLSRRNYVC
jgi:hypothetical protein